MLSHAVAMQQFCVLKLQSAAAVPCRIVTAESGVYSHFMAHMSKHVQECYALCAFCCSQDQSFFGQPQPNIARVRLTCGVRLAATTKQTRRRVQPQLPSRIRAEISKLWHSLPLATGRVPAGRWISTKSLPSHAPCRPASDSEPSPWQLLI